MGKKDSKGSTKLQLNSTAKFAVLDLEGITQAVAKLSTDEPPKKSDAKKESSKGGSKGSTQTNTRAKGKTEHTLNADSDLNLPDFKLETNPKWIDERLAKFQEIAKKRDEEFASKDQTAEIVATLPDGKTLTGTAWQTSPYDVAKQISQGLADSAIVARLVYTRYVKDYDPLESGDAGEDIMMGAEESSGDAAASSHVLWDMNRPLVGDCNIEFLKFDDKDGKDTFWHSSAHILGETLESLMGANLTIGPPLSGGFYYDAWIGDEVISEELYPKVEAAVNKVVKQKQKFERLVVTKEEALDLFATNPFKLEIIKTKVPDDSRTTVYRCGPLIDLCRGPHLTSTSKVKAFTCAKHSSTNWMGDVTKPSLQRMYGVSFPDKKMLKLWKENLQKAKERDHRLIGKKQDLFFFSQLSPGSAFFLPHGTRIYNKLVDFIKEHLHQKGYTEVITPNVYNLDLWHTSGHALHYKDAMFTFDVEGQEWGMKPMNCPGHCLLYGHTIRSHRDLPMRLADFGVLHRNELSGALTGLTRVRRFQQDDGHIFCRQDQIEAEVVGALNFMKDVYNTFGMSYKLELSTRPEKALGDVELWKMAEAALARAMDEFIGPGNWRENPGDGAFYGPKIDIKVMDAMDRVHQCATIQLDFQLPIRFDLTYQTGEKNEDGSTKLARPVLVHRAMLGSVERMFAVLCEHYGGKWPLWLSPRQVMLIPVHKDFIPYCEEIRKMLHDLKIYVDISAGRETFQKKVRNAQLAQYNYQLVVGEAEMTNRSVNVRTRENKVEGELKLDDLITKLTTEIREFK